MQGVGGGEGWLETALLLLDSVMINLQIRPLRAAGREEESKQELRRKGTGLFQRKQ